MYIHTWILTALPGASAQECLVPVAADMGEWRRGRGGAGLKVPSLLPLWLLDDDALTGEIYFSLSLYLSQTLRC